MSLNTFQLREYIIIPTLKQLDLWSLAAEELVLGTCIQESGLRLIKQQGGGPALGLWQMEPATHDDIWINFLQARGSLAAKVLGTDLTHNAGRLLYDLRYGCAMCRIHYFRKDELLPAAGDLHGQAIYWKKHYNTIKGKGKPEEYIANWNRLTAHS
ncbi:MAG: hypothetical protein HQL75_00430 [Magnetococcales bacterium]|nr:hypothetical protein [Magnetococcales bacterium]